MKQAYTDMVQTEGNTTLCFKNTVILIRLFENSSSFNIFYQNIQQWHANYLVKQTINDL